MQIFVFGPRRTRYLCELWQSVGEVVRSYNQLCAGRQGRAGWCYAVFTSHYLRSNGITPIHLCRSKIFAKLASQFYSDNLQHCTAQLIAISATKSRWRDTVCYGVLDGDGIKPHNKMQTQLCLYNCLELNCFIDPTVYNRLWLLIKIEDKQ